MNLVYTNQSSRTQYLQQKDHERYMKTKDIRIKIILITDNWIWLCR